MKCIGSIYLLFAIDGLTDIHISRYLKIIIYIFFLVIVIIVTAFVVIIIIIIIIYFINIYKSS